MAQERTTARREWLGDPPSEVHIEIVREPSRRFRGRASGAVALAALS